jgi:hypothetical protein
MDLHFKSWEVRPMRPLFMLSVVVVLAGCGTTIGTLRVPLHEGPRPLMTDTSGIEIRDLRPEAERVTHTGKAFSCQRWYGDDTFMPAKLEYLKHLLAARLPRGGTMSVRVEHFDIVEHCEDTANKAGAAAATGASYGAGNPTVQAASGVPGGDRVEVRFRGSVGRYSFEVIRTFDYSDLRWKFTELPAANAEYRERLRRALGEVADELVQRIPGPVI